MKHIFLIIVLAVSMTAKAQVSRVSLQASGLTCSMCSNSINKALKTLDFVAHIEADVKHYTFDISFKPDTFVDFNQIRKKVEDAGFFVSSFVAVIDFDKLSFSTNQSVKIANQQLVFVNKLDQPLRGTQKITLLDRGFVSSKQAKARPLFMSIEDIITYHVTQ
ncbi:heavy-metal-associated domain-containing protein [Flavisolibacter tropicus]|uniref:heavy-metal-associated domain-containing protein n=1 Tax=Flavisolibacter tropicus TaxID=1492898 RepID=UPI00131462AB|nr:heavy-metal-associated domain-containing protein [Flavisolibacter tropicus]